MDRFICRIALPQDADEIYNIMQKVYNNLDNKSLFVCDDYNFVNTHIKKSGFIVIVCDSMNTTAGCLIVRYPGSDDDNLGKDIGLSDFDQLLVAHMESAVVLPQYRGNNLQFEMINFAEQNIDTSRYRYILSTVSPDNIYSRNNLIKCGYKFVLNKIKYEGLSRDIYIKYLT